MVVDWYPEAHICISLALKHRLYTLYKKSIPQMAIEYFKDRAERYLIMIIILA
jgi:hypothetical protein